MELALASLADVDAVMKLIHQAKRYLKQCGIDQWQSGYPDKTCIVDDIKRQNGYLVKEVQAVIGYVCVDFGGEPAYEHLSGAWKSRQPYAVVHRLAIDNTCKGRGLSFQIIRLVEDLCHTQSIHSIKVDTDAHNSVMKHVLEKSGFVYCGTVSFDDGPKIAYEKLI